MHGYRSAGWCFFVLAFLSANSAAREVEAGISLHQFSYAEKFPYLEARSEEKAFLREAYLGFQQPLFDGVGLRVRAALSSQNIQYFGLVQGIPPRRFAHHSTMVHLEALADFALRPQDELQVYVGLGVHHWMRGAFPAGDGYGPFPQERYRWFYVPVGVRWRFLTRQSIALTLDVSVRANLGGVMRVRQSDLDPALPTVRAPLGAAFGGRISVPVAVRCTDSMELRFQPFVEYRTIGRGDVVRYHDTNGNVASLEEPASQTYLYGATFGPAVRF